MKSSILSLCAVLGFSLFIVSAQDTKPEPPTKPEPAKETKVDPSKLSCEYTYFIQKPQKDVWEAMVQKKHADKYYMSPLVKFQLFKGGVIQYGAGDNVLIEGRVLDIKEGTSCRHSFSFLGGESKATSEVEFTLSPVSKTITKLTLTHKKFTGKDAAQLHADVKRGWPYILCSLKTYLETGKAIQWPQ